MRALLLLLLALPVAADPSEALQELEHRLKRRSSTNEELVASLKEVARAYPDADETYKKAADKVVLRALHLEKLTGKPPVNLRHAVQYEAARALGHARPAAYPTVEAAALRILKDTDYEKEHRFYQALFSALVRLNPARAFDWLIDKAVTAQPTDEHRVRTAAALDAMMRATGIAAGPRMEAMKRILSIYQAFQFHVEDDYHDVAGYRKAKKAIWKKLASMGHYWAALRPTVMEALRHLSTDPVTGRPALDLDTGSEMRTLARYKVWFGQNKRLGRSPWLDPKGGEPAAGHTPRVPSTWLRYGEPWTEWWARNRTLLDRPGPYAAEKILPILFDALTDTASEVRAVAALGLARLGAGGAEGFLRERLDKGKSRREREAAMLGLGLLRDATLSGFFKKVVEDGEETARVRAYAVLALGRLKETAYLNRIRDGEYDSELKACAVWFAEDAAALAKVLGDDRLPGAVRGHSGTGLLRLKAPATLPAILRVLGDRDAAVRSAAAIGLGVMPSDDEGTLNAVRRHLLGSRGRFGGDRALIGHSLARIGALGLLEEEYRRCLTDQLRFAERGHLLLALGRANAQAFLRAQLGELDHDRDLGACAIALAMTQDTTSIPALRARLATSRGEYAAPGMLALGLLGDPEAVVLVRDVLRRQGGAAVLQEGALSLALLLKDAAIPELAELWERCWRAADYDALAWAFHLTGSEEAFVPLLRVVKSGGGGRERAFALAGLVRLADREQLLNRFAADSNPYAGGAALLGLARHRDVPFLHD